MTASTAGAAFARLIPPVRTALILSLALVHLAKVLFLPGPALGLVQSVLAVAVVLLTIPFVTGAARGLAGAVFVAGAGLLLFARAPYAAWLKAFDLNLDLIALVVLVPLLGAAIEIGDYQRSLIWLYRRFVNNGVRLYAYNALLACGLGYMLNLGALPLVFALTPVERPDGELKRVLTTSIARGYTCALAISPNFAAVGFVAQGFKLDWWLLVQTQVPVVALMLVLGLALEYRRGRRVSIPLPPDDDRGDSYRPAAKFAELVLMIAASLVAVILVSGRTGLGLLTAVPVTAFFFTFLWILGLTRSPLAFAGAVAGFVRRRVSRTGPEVSLFVGAGLLAGGVEAAGLGQELARLIFSLSGGNPYALTALIAAVILAISMMGVHPVVTATVLLAVLDPATLGVTPLFLGAVILANWALGIAISPLSGDNMIVAAMAGESSLTVAIRWSLAYVLLAAVLSLALLHALRLAGLF